MSSQRAGIIVFAAAVSFSASAVIAQQASPDLGPGRGGQQENRRGRSNDNGRQNPRSSQPEQPNSPLDARQHDSGPSRSGGVLPQFDTSTLESRERIYSRIVNQYIDRIGRSYEINDQQKKQVRARLEELKAQQVTFSRQYHDEYESLDQESRRLRDAARDGQRLDSKRQQEVETRLNALRQSSPLTNWDHAIQEVERLMPPGQAQRGRAKDEAERQHMEEWFEQIRQIKARERQERKLRNGGGGGAGDVSEVVTEDGRRVRIIRENPISPWEQYLRDFIREYKLDDAQQATARSILREMQERRTAHEQTHRVDYENANKIQDTGEREKKLAELNQTVVRLFDELKLRLTRIPSSAQRQRMGTPGSHPS